MKRNILLILAICLINSLAFSQTFNGYALYSEQNSQNTYLIDKEGEIAHSWACNKNGNYAVFLKEDGNILRQGVVTSASMKGAAYGGIIQEYDKDAKVVWEFTYSSSSYQAHHDFAVMPNGNVLLTAWELKSGAEMSAAGYASSTEKWPTHIIEVQQDGTGGKVVWEWHMWDHLIQDKDAGKANYGVVADHPELMDINVSSTSKGGRDGDWFHVNGIDYNEKLDQIVFSSRYMSEIYIIDHSTTTAEAASHSGGNAGKGGDFLFRYGNPSNYDATGTKSIAAAVHDPRWIKSGRPNAGYIQFYNNSGGTGGSSVVDAINPVMAVDGYNYKFSGTFMPASNEWRHICLANSTGQSASDRMTNGNVFVNVSKKYMYEVDSLGKTVWQYSASTPKAFRYECEHQGIINLLNNPCNVSSVKDISQNKITLYPNPTTGIFEIEGLTISEYEVSVYTIYGQKVVSQNNKTKIDLNGIDNGHYFVQIKSGNQIITQKIALVK